ncbi:MAG: hypothetical protein ABRQ26_07750 [Syntrophomonadaceae bacterium]
MKKKSRFLVFILSPLPGLSHLYVGWPHRAMVFFMTFIGVCFAGGMISSLGWAMNQMMVPLTFFCAALIWFTAFAEALKLAGLPGGARATGDGEPNPGQEDERQLMISNRKLVTLAFSAIPGAGHMFMGLLKPGAQLMAAFFLVLFLGDWLEMSILAFLAPVIWFFGIFDVYHLLEEEEELKIDAPNLFDWIARHSKWVGWGLIAAGVLIIMQRLGGPVLGHWFNAAIRSYIQTSVVALLLIGGGIKLLTGSKSSGKGEEA